MCGGKDSLESPSQWTDQRPILLALKYLTPHNLMHQRPEAVVLFTDTFHKLFNLGLIDKPWRRTGRVGQELLRQRAGESILVLQEQLLELTYIGELRAIEDVGRVHFLPLVIWHP